MNVRSMSNILPKVINSIKTKMIKKYGIKKNLILIKLKSHKQLIKYKKKEICKEKDNMMFKLLAYSEFSSNL